MGIKTVDGVRVKIDPALKNLPTTWGLRLWAMPNLEKIFTLKNLPTTWGLRRCNQAPVLLWLCSEKPPHHMGIKTMLSLVSLRSLKALKNLPTTWGLRLLKTTCIDTSLNTLKNLPTTWGLRRYVRLFGLNTNRSEKPPHHMGIKTKDFAQFGGELTSEKPPHHMGIKTLNHSGSKSQPALKNLPTTWGLRLRLKRMLSALLVSEKPPHHMGIKTRNPTCNHSPPSSLKNLPTTRG